MGITDRWGTIEAERRALVKDLTGLRPEQWTTTSYCTGWSVQDVLAHMAGTARITPLSFFPKLAANGFNFTKLQARDIAQQKGGSPADTLAHFGEIVTSHKHPPGPGDTILAETIIHAQDIRGPLGIAHDYPVQAVVQVADFYKNSNLIVGTKKRIDGLTLRATDADWTHGHGPEVAGPIIALVMSMTGRKLPDGALTGDGVATLRSRG